MNSSQERNIRVL